MSATEFLQFLSQVLYLLISVAVTIGAARRPTRARIDIAVFFAVTTAIIAEGWIVGALGIVPGRGLGILVLALLMALPYLLIRLVSDFVAVPAAGLRAAEAGLALTVVAIVAFSPALPIPLTLLLVCYFVGLSQFVVGAFWRAARGAGGVTRRRMQAVAAGTGFLGLTILLAGLGTLGGGGVREALGVLQQCASAASGVGFFVGFAPPAILRRAWQEPELRAFLGRAASLPRLPDTAAIVRELERGAIEAVGAPTASIGLWDEATNQMYYTGPNGPAPYPADQLIGGRAFVAQRAVFAEDAPREDPAYAALYRATGATAILAAPITAGERRLGVLSVFAARAPIFAEEDLRLVQLLADQGAVILESRALIDEAARVRAREEAARLKDDFLSSAAHDLKTPLTALLASAQLLERRAVRQPDAPPDLAAIRRIVGQGQRLRAIVGDLLDAARVEGGQLVGRREAVDLAELAREVQGRVEAGRHQLLLDAPEPVVGVYDRARIGQLLENLIENAIKYSPEGGEIRVAISGDGEAAHLSVADRGIGILPEDVPHLFDRFQRGGNVDDRQFAGMGLGLYICRGIAEEHGGAIAVSSVPGEGSIFRVTLPRPGAEGAHPRQEAVRGRN